MPNEDLYEAAKKIVSAKYPPPSADPVEAGVKGFAIVGASVLGFTLLAGIEIEGDLVVPLYLALAAGFFVPYLSVLAAERKYDKRVWDEYRRLSESRSQNKKQEN